jgi:hypothetical protein
METLDKFNVVKGIIDSLKKRNCKPKKKQVYAVGTGTYVGEMLVFVREHGDSYHFLSIPKNRNRKVPIEKFNFAVEHKIIELVQELPSKIYKICVAQFAYNERHPVKQESPKETLK